MAEKSDISVDISMDTVVETSNDVTGASGGKPNTPTPKSPNTPSQDAEDSNPNKLPDQDQKDLFVPEKNKIVRSSYEVGAPGTGELAANSVQKAQKSDISVETSGGVTGASGGAAGKPPSPKSRLAMLKRTKKGADGDFDANSEEGKEKDIRGCGGAGGGAKSE